MQKLVAASERAIIDVLRHSTKMSKRKRLLEGGAFVLKSQLGKTEKSRAATVSFSDGPLGKLGALKAHVRMFCDQSDSFKRRKSTNSKLRVITCKLADA